MARCLVLAAVCWTLVGACDPDERPLRTAPVALLSGRVRLADGTNLPAYAPLDLARSPLTPSAAGAPPPECTSAQEAARHPVVFGDGRSLAGVVIGAADFTHLRERKPRTHKVVIEGCRLQPATVAAMGGDILHIENRDGFAFAPIFGPAFTARPLPRGAQPAKIPLTPGGVESVLCPREAPCGRTDVVVFHHPVFAVSGKGGAFRIDNFPADEMVRVTAWHPLFELEETFVWIGAGKRSAIDFVLRPRPRFLSP